MEAVPYLEPSATALKKATIEKRSSRYIGFLHSASFYPMLLCLIHPFLLVPLANTYVLHKTVKGAALATNGGASLTLQVMATSSIVATSLPVDTVVDPPVAGVPTSLIAQELVGVTILDVVLLDAPALASDLERVSSPGLTARGGAPSVEATFITLSPTS